APLLFISGGSDHILYTGGEDGWEQVADLALDWALAPIHHLRRPRLTRPECLSPAGTSWAGTVMSGAGAGDGRRVAQP
ncbi:MAG: hypothetical protein ACRDN0_34140, partial [Trebonia sp.]